MGGQPSTVVAENVVTSTRPDVQLKVGLIVHHLRNSCYHFLVLAVNSAQFQILCSYTFSSHLFLCVNSVTMPGLKQRLQVIFLGPKKAISMKCHHYVHMLRPGGSKIGLVRLTDNCVREFAKVCISMQNQARGVQGYASPGKFFEIGCSKQYSQQNHALSVHRVFSTVNEPVTLIGQCGC